MSKCIYTFSQYLLVSDDVDGDGENNVPGTQLQT
jgi:hypothetical protein